MTKGIRPKSTLRSPDQSSNASLNLRIVYRRCDGLKPDPANPRRHTKTQIRKIAESIKAFGFNVPIVIDRDGNVIAGHGRLLPESLAAARCRRCALITSRGRKPAHS